MRMHRSLGCWAVPVLAVAVGFIGGCVRPVEDGQDWAAIVLDLKPEDATPRGDRPTTLERAWIGFNLAEEKEGQPVIQGPETVHVRLRTGPADANDPQARASETFEVRNVDVGRPRSSTGEALGPTVITLDSPAASLTMTGGPIDWPYGREKVIGGVSRVAFNRDFLGAAREIDAEPPTVTLLRAALVGVDAAELGRYGRLELQPSLDDVIRLVQAGVDPGSIESYYLAGYGQLSVEELIRLRQADVAVEDAVAFRRDGFDLGADDLIRLRQQDVTPEYARGLKQAGFAQDVDMLVRLRNEQVTTEYANQMKRLGVAPDEASLVKLHRARITPVTVETYQKARYTPNADDLLALQAGGVKAEDALFLREAGYDFTQADLIKLAKWQVPVSFTLSLMSPGFEPLSADQIVDMRLRRVTPEMVRVLRQPRERGNGVPAEADAVDEPRGGGTLPVALPELPPPEPLDPAMPGG